MDNWQRVYHPLSTARRIALKDDRAPTRLGLFALVAWIKRGKLAGVGEGFTTDSGEHLRYAGAAYRLHLTGLPALENPVFPSRREGADDG